MALLDLLRRLYTMRERSEAVLQTTVPEPFYMLLSQDAASRVPWVGLPDPLPEEVMPERGELAVFLGRTENLNIPVFWMPMRLLNPLFFVTGGPGAGKSTTFKTITTRMKQEGVSNILIIDFVGEYVEYVESFMKGEILRLGEGAYINILDLAGLHPRLRVEQVLTALSAEFNLENAPRQKNLLRTAIVRAYSDKGIPINTDTRSREFWRQYSERSPTLADVHEKVEEIVENLESGVDEDLAQSSGAKESLSGLVEKLGKYRHPPFNVLARKSTIPLEKILTDPGVLCIDLSPLKSESMKAMVALTLLHLQVEFMREFPMNTGKVRNFLVLDEAWKVLKVKENNPLETMAREARKYGLSLMIASQKVRDLNEDMFAMFGTYLILNTSEHADLSYVKSSLGLNQREVEHISKGGRGKGLMVLKTTTGVLKFAVRIDPVLSSDIVNIVFPERVTDMDALIKTVASIYSA